MKSTLLRSEGATGTMIRAGFVLAMTFLGAAIAWAISHFSGGSLRPTDVLIVIAAIGIPMVLGVLASEYPPGVEFVFVRLAGATFCRTGLPLLVVLLLNYGQPEWIDRQILPIVLAYAGGFVASVLLSVFRLSATSSVTSDPG